MITPYHPIRQIARWLARIDGINGHLSLAMLALTGLSTGTSTLKQYGYGDYAWFLIIGVVVLIPLYALVYSEYGVRNQVERDKADLSTNFAGPTIKIDDETIGVAVFAAIHKRPPNDQEIKLIEKAVNERMEKYRDGVKLHDY